MIVVRGSRSFLASLGSSDTNIYIHIRIYKCIIELTIYIGYKERVSYIKILRDFLHVRLMVTLQVYIYIYIYIYRYICAYI
jgi:hypothetical protein